ncbi:zinc-finger domain-containing protein [Colletotrichum graminicola]|uniref:Zinc-finger domain-containing protein n=1 Tax=Colletotrichum graminicola (strain M1.001 / M2 / FGSC 10212) TaxID=645133 RepID=E3QR56_COLGM|nr:zinc-finger domain-containing protein [Colletotrichum graminicola M1.001]EFQ33344.1 zinc-finger domain-containing protein [Colletotrichum graminicola M1.001]WDK15657.1 zinc-finger domain-containing protein [Colletotrichum graminicola]
MLSASRRATSALSRQLRVASRPFSVSTTVRTTERPAVVEKNEAATPQVADNTVPATISQAPNRAVIWSRSQKPRAEAMTGPRFEQTDFSLQPQPYAAIELIHQEPVRWTHKRVVACDGGGGPAGHPRIFINTDKPEICTCNYCGLPFANEHHREHLESLPETSYPLA